ncbi:hypothetical protein [Salinivibrio sp. IB282]|nr:hypothetical protein [Salinivibrio sp. IB282]
MTDQSNNNQSVQWQIAAGEQPTDDPLLDCLVLLTEHYGTPARGMR